MTEPFYVWPEPFDFDLDARVYDEKDDEEE